MRVSNLFVLAFFVFVSGSLSGQFISKGTHTMGSSVSLAGGLSPIGIFYPNQGGITTSRSEVDNFLGGVDEDFFDRYFIHSGYSYFVANNFSVGADLTLIHVKSGFVEQTDLYLSPEVRYFIKSPFFISAASNLSYVDEEFEFNSISFSAGYSFFPSPDWAIEPRLLYTDLLAEEGTFRGEGFMFNVGFRYYPGRMAGDSSRVESALRKGNLLFGGRGRFDFGQEEFTLLQISPRVGYFVSDQWVLGGGLDYVYEKSNFPPGGLLESESDQTLFGNVFARYYMYKGLFAELEGGLMLFNTTKINGETPDVWNTSAWYYNARVGYSWFISPAVAFEPTLHFGRTLYSFEFETFGVGTSPTVETFESKQQAFGLEFSIHVFLDR
jgi:hypothetical protein